MTYYEVLYWWAWLVVPIFIFVCSCALDAKEENFGFFLGVGWITLFCIGGITTAVQSDSENYKITSKFETIPKVVHLDDTGLNVVTDDNKLITYTNHKNITTWKNGGKFYKVYSFNKENFGVDGNKYEILIESEKVEQ